MYIIIQDFPVSTQSTETETKRSSPYISQSCANYYLSIYISETKTLNLYAETICLIAALGSEIPDSEINI